MKDVFLNWHLGHTFGWGILGLNVFCQWANDPEIRPLMGHPITREAFGVCDPLRIRRVSRAVDHSNRFLAGVTTDADGRRFVKATVIDPVGNGFAAPTCRGDFNVARCIFENTDLSRARDTLGRYEALLTASHWNAELVAKATGREAVVIPEGVDTSLFCPGPRSGLMDPERFHVFSGGKVELRKGQDLVLLAFGKFREKRANCVLVTAWQSIWPHLSVGFRGRAAAPVALDGRGMLDIARWASQNGIDPQAVIDIGLVPNALMPSVLREMDVALQPSRAEACTNLPAKEAMACGVPVIAAMNTGMLDLLTDDNCIPLRRQARVEVPGAVSTDGWGESDVDEMVAALEFAYEHREEARRIGMCSRDWLIRHGRTWEAHARELKRWILSLCA
jgi:glycosyltransferase involved in cell wall biosynthesis